MTEKLNKPYLHWPGIDMVFWRKKFFDPLSDLLFTLLGQKVCPKWSLKDWTEKDVLKSDEKYKNHIYTGLVWIWFFEEKSFVTQWATYFSHYLVKHGVSSDHWWIGLRNILKSYNKIEKTISTPAWYRYGFLKKKVLWPTERPPFHITWSNTMSQGITEGLD